MSGSGEERTWTIYVCPTHGPVKVKSGGWQAGACPTCGYPCSLTKVVEASAWRAEREAREKERRELSEQVRELEVDIEVLRAEHAGDIEEAGTALSEACERAEKAEEALRKLQEAAEAVSGAQFSSNQHDHVEAIQRLRAALSSAAPLPEALRARAVDFREAESDLIAAAGDAFAAGISATQVAREAGVPYSRALRWRRGA